MLPPIPLAIMEHGVFHRVSSQANPDPTETQRPTVYTLEYVDRGAWFADDDSVFLWQPGDAVHLFTAVFAPTNMEVRVLHVWQRFDESADDWVTVDTIDVSTSGGVQGGAERGFRTWSRKQNVEPGSWRVRVELDSGRHLGTSSFSIEAHEGPREWLTRVVY